MDTDYIFKLFNNSIEHKSDDLIEKEVRESAHFNVKMFIKYITNLKNFQLKLLLIAKREDGVDIESDTEKAEWIGYHKAFSHLSKVNLYKSTHVNDLDLLNPYDLSYCIQITKTYFLRLEDYDKVSFLQELLDFVEKRYNENLEISE